MQAGANMRRLHRMRFRGTRRALMKAASMRSLLAYGHILLKDFKTFASGITAEVRQAAEDVAVPQQRPLRFLNDNALNKEAWARQVAQRDGIQHGLIGVLKAVERCWS